jgi:hypothetical protein
MSLGAVAHTQEDPAMREAAARFREGLHFHDLAARGKRETETRRYDTVTRPVSGVARSPGPPREGVVGLALGHDTHRESHDTRSQSHDTSSGCVLPIAKR